MLLKPPLLKFSSNILQIEYQMLVLAHTDLMKYEVKIRGRFHKKSQFETSFGLSLGLKSETFVSAEFLAQMDFTKGGSAEIGLKS